MIQLPERLDRLQLGLIAVLDASLLPVQVGWSYGQAAFSSMPGDLVNLQLSAGPTPRQTRVQGSVILPFDTLTIKVDSATPGDRIGVVVNEIAFFRDVEALDTPATMAAGLLAQLGADPVNDPWTVAPGLAADELVLTPVAFGSVWRVGLLGSMSAPARTSSGLAAMLSEGVSDCTITAQAFSKHREPRNGAWSIASRLLATLRAHDHVDTLHSFGLAITSIGGPTDISGLSGGNWETRTTLDFVVGICSAFTRPVGTIEALELGLDFTDPGGGSFATVVTTIPSP